MINLQPGDLLHLYFPFYNVTFNSIFTIILRIFPTLYKWAPGTTIRLILTTLNNEQRPWKNIIIDDDGALEKSTDVTYLIVD